MAEILTKVESVLVHYKDNEIVAITHSNGHDKLLKTVEMSKADKENFYETNVAQLASKEE